MVEGKVPTGLKVEYWYHACVWIGAAGAIGSAAVHLDGIHNRDAFLLSIGVLMGGIGEWMNHPFQTYLLPPAPQMPWGGKGSGHMRKNCLLGILLDIAGAAFAVLSLIRIVAA